MEVTGNVVDILAEETGTSKNGTWRKQSFVLETLDQYPKKVCIMIWGEKIDQIMPKKGDHVTAHINVESREYNGRWYTDVKAWKVDNTGSSQNAGAADSTISEPPPQDFAPMDDDDLPF